MPNLKKLTKRYSSNVLKAAKGVAKAVKTVATDPLGIKRDAIRSNAIDAMDRRMQAERKDARKDEIELGRSMDKAQSAKAKEMQKLRNRYKSNSNK